jgi:hypothetical protein
MIALVLGLCVINIWDSVVVVRREYRYPYSGAADAAAYLKAVGADQQRMYGLLFGINAVQAYFDHNIFLNTSTTYTHLAAPTMASELHPEEETNLSTSWLIPLTLSCCLIKTGLYLGQWAT